MSKIRILAAALDRFSHQGYEATSISQIASDVGIKKPSIYAHFNSKKDIFHILLKEAFLKEADCLEIFSTSNDQSGECLKKYLFSILDRFEKDSFLHFWLYAIYMPPLELQNEIRCIDDDFSQLMDDALKKAPCLQHPGNHLKLPISTVMHAYTGIIRGIHAELLYKGCDNAREKTIGLWKMFELVFKD